MNAEMVYLWRAVYPEGKIHESYITKPAERTSSGGVSTLPRRDFRGVLRLGIPAACGLPGAVRIGVYSNQWACLRFWPGSDTYPHAAFYVYAGAAPSGYAEAHITPDAARYETTFGEFILLYEAV